VLPKLEAGMNDFLATLPFIRTFLQALLGSDLGGNISGQMLQAILWTHPVVLAIVWAHEITFCTRMPAAEIDRGTIDLLLSWPASRVKILAGESLVWLLSGVMVLAMGFVGHLISAIAVHAQATPPASREITVLLNLYCVYVAVGGLAYFISAMSDSRGRALAATIAIVLASFLVSFVVQIWPDARALTPLGILSYYRPAVILATGIPPWGDMARLVGSGMALWWAASQVFARRNICTI
jgi:ABC-type transport system involved in multi-copper enzyme maturation permease subunit